MTKQELSSSTQNFVLHIDNNGNTEDVKQSKLCRNNNVGNICKIFNICIITLLIIMIFYMVIIIIDIFALCKSNKENCNNVIVNDGTWLFFVFLVLIITSIMICIN